MNKAMVLQSLMVLRRRLDRPTVLQMLYLDNPSASLMVPQEALNIVKKVCENSLTQQEAEKELGELIATYQA